MRRRLGRALPAAILVVALVGTAVIAYRWGAGDRDETPVARPSASPSATAPPTVSEVYSALAPSVVSITSVSKTESASGTGVIVNADGNILTALHVVDGATAIQVVFADGTQAKAQVAASDAATDIAVLLPDQLPSVVVPAVLGGGAAVGDDVIAIGNPLGLTLSTTTGVVSGLNRSLTREGKADLKGLIQFDAAVNPGSSGGPLLNAAGQVVGVVVALANPTKDGTFIGIGFAVPIGTAVGAGGERPPQI
ncbi:S1-C subfamily serine protease [Hamadaea flava]|uniref:S1C family serine protease n=1 Tax=Hamadaea flava TaxID=1742688 RepID=A0ABV8LXY3_9ACTN|nr:trypsin-like peptidase domain-containing protein [Hamadaea flava]MCP2328887.1 S1-C subfamily serine protease [Hamadaea flava]